MLNNFSKYIKEGFGANTMETDPVDMILDPSTDLVASKMFYVGNQGRIPTHWNNSPALTGGRLTSAFGANPNIKKLKILRYQEFLELKNKTD